MTTNVSHFFGALKQGLTEQQLGAVLSSVSKAVLNHDSKGELVITLKVEPLTLNQVKVVHKIAHKQPKSDGGKGEYTEGETVFYLNPDDSLTDMPKYQDDAFGLTREQETSINA